MASPTAWPERFMKVWGLMRSDFSPARLPSATSPWNFFDQGEKEWRRAIASAAMKPILCRLPACFGPGLPRPAMSSIDASSSARRLFLFAFLLLFLFGLFLGSRCFFFLGFRLHGR